MKITVINGLLANEAEMKRILDLVIHEFDKYDLSINYVDLAEEKLNTFGGVSTVQMDQIFNKVLVADAIIFATSIHMGNITPLMQNFFNYFELGKYKAAMQNKNILSVMIHNTDDELIPYTVMMNFYKKFNAYEVNKLFLNIPDVITDEYLDKTCKYIKTRTKEFASILDPSKVEKVETDVIDNKKINQMLKSNDLVYDANHTELKNDKPSDVDIKELTGMVNDKLKVKAIIKEEPKEKDVTEITQKYKSKIEQMMEETLFGGEDDSEAEKAFEAAKEAPIEKENPLDNINFKKNVEDKRDFVKSPEEERIEREENESIDNLIARVVARTKEEREAEKANETIKYQELVQRTPAIPRSFSKPSDEVIPEDVYGDYEEEIVEPKYTVNYDPQDYIDDYPEEEMSFEDEYDFKDNFMDGQISLEENEEENNKQFIRSLKTSDEELKKSANEITEIKFLKDTQKVEEEKASVKEDVDRFEPDSIKELRKKLNSIRMQRDEIVNEVNEMKNEMASDLKNVEEQKVSISKFSLADFKEPHEVIEYEEVPTVKERNNDSKMSLKDMTKNLMYLFKPIEGEQLKALVQINVEGDEGFTVYANIMDNKCSIFEGVNQNNDITIYVKDDKWRSILNGEVTLQRAFMTGLVKVTGNFMMLNKLDNSLLAYNKD